MTKLIAISKDGKRQKIFNGFEEALRGIKTNLKALKLGVLHGHEVKDIQTGEIWYLDELFEGDEK